MRPVAILVDNASSHCELCDVREQVRVIPLPSKVTAVQQTMDVGNIFVFKKMYRKLLLRELVRDIETRQQRRETRKGHADGMKGSYDGYAPHMLDVTKIVKRAWEIVSEITIARCWVKSECSRAAKSAMVKAT